MSYGNGVVANISYSPDRLQLQCLRYDTTGIDNPCTKDSSAKFMLTYAYGSSGSNNGQITGIYDSVDNGRSVAYSYDGLGRLSSAITSGSSGYPAWGLSWTYDRYGNRLTQTVTAGSAYPDTQTYGTTYPNNGAYTNHPDGHSFDPSGNMTNDGVNTLTYDAAGKLITASVSGTGVGAYVYDGHGLRVQKCVPNCTSPTTTSVYIFAGSKVIAEYDNPSGSTPSPTREYIYSGNRLVARFTSSATNYYLRDHLSNRVITDSSGTVIEQLGHYPYGETWYDTGSEKWKFSIHERDSESANDFAMARYIVSRLGRFSSPDLHSGRLIIPQSLNRYAYALDDPINMVDLLGLDAEAGNCWWGGSEDGSVDDGGADPSTCVKGGGAWCDSTGCTWDVGYLDPDTGNGPLMNGGILQYFNYDDVAYYLKLSPV
ncbi:MAG: RHS repeat-associated core domain-containing protein [Candidatus Acidiferrales bacterium]